MKEFYKCMRCKTKYSKKHVTDKETYGCPAYAFYEYDRWKEENLWCYGCMAEIGHKQRF